MTMMNNEQNDSGLEATEERLDRENETRETLAGDTRAAVQEDELVEQANREVLLEHRRARQTGKTRGISKKMALGGVLVVGTAIVALLAIPGLLSGLSLDGKSGLDTSKVDLTVETKRDTLPYKLDLTGLKSPPAPVDDKTKGILAQLTDLQSKLNGMETSKDGSLTKANVDALIQKMNKDFDLKLTGERAVLKQETDRLRDESKRQQDDSKRQQDQFARLQEENERQRQQALVDAEAQRQLQEQERVQAELQRKDEDIKAKQRESSLLVLDGSENGVALAGQDGTGGDGGLGIGAGPGLGLGSGSRSGTGSSSGSQNEQFLAANGNASYVTAWAKSLANPSKTIVQGTIISGVLETAIDTQLPGNIRAQVIEPVFSYDGSHILMPAGTLLIGTFNPQIDIEQRRVLIAWNRAITPDGDTVAIGGTGADLLGRTGTAGNVNNRYFKKFGSAVLVSAITIAPELLAAKFAPSGTSKTDVSVPTVGLSLGGQNGDPFGQLASGVGEPITDVLNKFLDLPPIIRVPQGEEIRIFVNRDLVFR